MLIVSSFINQKREWLSSLHLPKITHCRIDDSGIFFKRNYYQITIPWQYIIKFVETKSVYRIYISNLSLQNIPKRVLKETDIVAINKLVRNKLDNKVQLKT
ncbi:MAG: YcxB family protein [Candidatus Heimdallarchaeota archaeon]|nr:YcxB family protein [Candidatus Heimdallarchaeota archaeon]